MQAISDSHLAYLLSLGFELELCQQALKSNTTLEDATEWILNPNRAPVQRPQRDPVVSSTVQSSDKIQQENKVIRQTQQRASERLTNEIRRARQLEREAKKKVLADIQQDKERRKNRLHPTENRHTTEPVSSSSQLHHLSQALVQLKLTDSSTTRQAFSPEQTISELIDFVYQKEISIHPQDVSIDMISLVSVFPRRTYTSQDHSVTLREAGFLPNVSLNVQLLKPTEDTEMDQGSEDSIAEEEEEEEEEHSIAEDQGLMDIDQAPSIDPHRPPANMANRNWSRLNIGHQPITHVVMPDQHQESDSQQDNERRNLLLHAIQHHIESTTNSSNTTSHPTKPGLERHSRALRDICASSVSVLLSQHSTASSRYLKKIAELPSDVAEYLIKRLEENGKLNVSNLRKLANHCYLQNILLDSYLYCTDSLIDSLSKTNSSISISKISLRGCDVITDNGISSLAGLKQLNYLDVSNCKLTDKGLRALEKLCHLVYLNMSKTKITDKGISSMLLYANYKEELQTLVLDGCQHIKSSRTLVPMINEFPNIIYLSLARTSLGEQEVMEGLRKNVQLRYLNMSQTQIVDRDLTGILCQFRLLQELNLSNCHCLSTRALAFLPTELKQLENVQFPNNDNEMDGVLARYRDLPLKKLELSSFCITDEGAGYIGCLKYLQILNLEGTMITDQGIAHFKDLIELERLYLDRTELTDEGIQHIIALSHLHTLSLSHTAVTNRSLRLISNYEKTGFARCLKTLNLSQCPGITDRGVRSLSKMIHLTHLNLDHTGVSKACLGYLKDLQHLKPVRLLGIEKEQDDDDEEEEEEMD